MKLRIKGDSLRMRLTKSEVARLRGSGLVKDTVNFSGTKPAALVYELRASEDCREPVADFQGGRIKISVPVKTVIDWAESERVAIRGGSGAVGEGLSILIEKDFACLSGKPSTDETDNFPNPGAGRSC